LHYADKEKEKLRLTNPDAKEERVVRIKHKGCPAPIPTRILFSQSWRKERKTKEGEEEESTRPSMEGTLWRNCIDFVRRPKIRKKGEEG